MRPVCPFLRRRLRVERQFVDSHPHHLRRPHYCHDHKSRGTRQGATAEIHLFRLRLRQHARVWTLTLLVPFSIHDNSTSAHPTGLHRTSLYRTANTWSSSSRRRSTTALSFDAWSSPRVRQRVHPVTWLACPLQDIFASHTDWPSPVVRRTGQARGVPVPVQ